MPTTEVYLVDTSAWIQAVSRSRAPSRLTARIGDLMVAGQLATTELVVLELLVGAKTESEYRVYAARMAALHRLATDLRHWELAGRIGFQLRRDGITVPTTDLLIAAVAMEAGATLLHRDRHFDVIAERFPLHVESHAG